MNSGPQHPYSKESDAPCALSSQTEPSAPAPQSLGSVAPQAVRISSHDELLGSQAQELEARRLESLGQLAGGVAHEFNNLLSSVLGNVTLALLDLPPDSPARTSIEAIEGAALRGSELAKQLLACSGKGSFFQQVIGLTDIVQEMAQKVEFLRPKAVAIRYELDTQAAPIDGDLAQIRLALLNLVSNAAEAILPQTGTISIQTGTLTCNRAYLQNTFGGQSLPEGKYSYLTVIDTGCGIERAIQDKIFDPYFTTKFVGRGLGLAAVLGLMRSHQGAIRVRSTPERGTAIQLLFPISQAPHTARPLPTQRDSQGTVLVVSDEEWVRNVAQRALEKKGFAVQLATSGPQAVSILGLGKKQIVAALLDVTRPPLAAAQTLKQLRRIQAGIPALVCITEGQKSLWCNCPPTSPIETLHKPFIPTTLLEALRNLLHKSPLPA